MLELKPSCERCGTALPPESLEARICTYECTFCSECTAGPLGDRCPNCRGPLVPRPARLKLPDRSPRMACERSGPYAPREFRFHGVAVLGDWHVKRYSIRYGDRPGPSPEEWAVAAAVAGSVLDAQAQGGPAFLVLHLGRDGDYLLVDWWSDEDILNQRLLTRARGEERFRDLRHRPWVACVWELAVIEAERQAWIDTAMAGAPQDYLSRHLEGGVR